MRRLVLAAALAAAVPAALPGVSGAQPTGEQMFNDNCGACHQKTGLGVKGAFPPLAGNTLVQGPSEPLATTVLVGRGGMPAFKSDLDDAQLAAILSYVRGAWGNKADPVTPTDVATARTKAAAQAQEKNLLAH